MEMKLWAETPRLQTGWGQGSSMMRTSAGTKSVPVRLLITEIRDGEEKNVRILHKLSSVFNSIVCLLYTSPSPRDRQKSRMPSSA